MIMMTPKELAAENLIISRLVSRGYDQNTATCMVLNWERPEDDFARAISVPWDGSWGDVMVTLMAMEDDNEDGLTSMKKWARSEHLQGVLQHIELYYACSPPLPPPKMQSLDVDSE